MIPGADRSHHNGKVPLTSLATKGIKFIWFKAAQWTSGEDSTFDAAWKEAKAIRGLLRGAYYFFDPRYDGTAQCKQFLSLGIDFKAPGCIGGCVDVEDLVVYGIGRRIDSAATAAANKWVADNWELALSRLNDFLNYFKQETGLNCVIYSYNNYMREYLHSHPFPDNPMWLSSLQKTCPVRYDTGELPQYWQNIYAWNGTDMDGDFFTGTEQQLNILANVA